MTYLKWVYQVWFRSVRVWLWRMKIRIARRSIRKRIEDALAAAGFHSDVRADADQ